jgi:hypothetical protein
MYQVTGTEASNNDSFQGKTLHFLAGFMAQLEWQQVDGLLSLFFLFLFFSLLFTFVHSPSSSSVYSFLASASSIFLSSFSHLSLPYSHLTLTLLSPFSHPFLTFLSFLSFSHSHPVYTLTSYSAPVAWPLEAAVRE